MSTASPPVVSQDDVVMAAEYMLGLVSPAEQAQIAARIAVDKGFAREVAAWETRLNPMLGGADTAPSPDIWGKIESRIGPSTGQDIAHYGVRMWQGLSAFSTSVAAVLAVMMLNTPSPTAVSPAPLLLAALGSETGSAAMTASYQGASGTLILTPVSMKTGDLYPELWVIPEGGAAQSLGIIKSDRPSQILVRADLQLLLNQGATLAITPEPITGAPGGKATGPVIASGKIITI